VRIVSGASLNLRHFQCTLEPIPKRDWGSSPMLEGRWD
jgi:hypothetical protein